MSEKSQISAVGVNSPACLPLGAVLDNGRPALLGITLLYPPVTLAVKRLGELSVTGARAQIGREQALGWFRSQERPPQAEVEIELAIPAQMGLGSEALLGLSIGRGLAEFNGVGTSADPIAAAKSVGLGPEWALEAHCFAAGGVQVVDPAGGQLRRRAVQHDDKNAWVFVIYLPRPTSAAPEELEATQRQTLLQTLDRSPRDVEPLWQALMADNVVSFGAELMAIQERTLSILAEVDLASPAAEESGQMLDAIRQKEGLAWGQSFGGLALWGLVKGAGPSQQTRILMRRVAGYDGGAVTAAITDNAGVKIQKVRS